VVYGGRGGDADVTLMGRPVALEDVVAKKPLLSTSNRKLSPCDSESGRTEFR
jgi:hypothetical protein